MGRGYKWSKEAREAKIAAQRQRRLAVRIAEYRHTHGADPSQRWIEREYGAIWQAQRARRDWELRFNQRLQRENLEEWHRQRTEDRGPAYLYPNFSAELAWKCRFLRARKLGRRR